ncbi:MAG: enoyl-CoA hydratase/isomerase family protein [Deltaproteobacteria bacterium]|nr:enoyl-CoA hydratase/isomerase family protein [Deltaproteobacteria bacterium]
MEITTNRREAEHRGKQATMKPEPSSFRLVDKSDLAKGLFALYFDLAGEKVNKFNPDTMMELDGLLESMKTRDDIKALVFLSGKENIFIAGADITYIQAVKEASEGERLAKQGQSVLQKLERMPFPVVAAVNGACMGGGTELALCCKYIVVSDAPGTKIGLPEVNLGLLPGWGGTVRLPERIGLQAALDFILTGKTMDGPKALKLGYADACFSRYGFEAKALGFGARVARGEKISRPARKKPLAATVTSALLEENPIGRAVLFMQARKMILARTRGHYPAPLKILDVMSKSYGKPRGKALEIESKAFGELSFSDVSKRLIELFFATEKVKKQTGVSGARLQPGEQIQSAGLLGAGVMGGGIAQLLAHKGIPVRMKDIDLKGLAIGTSAATRLFSDLVKKRKMTRREADIRFALISPTTDYSGFGRADLVIEAIVENMDVKKKVLQEVEPLLREGATIATNTSSLSVSGMASACAHPENVVGMHFFNPVHRMPLVEVIRAEKTSDRAVMRIFELSKRLGKTPIVVRDGAGFLVNRLLMPYLNEASYIMSEGAPIEELDEAVLDFGLPMGPAHLLDEIGIDVAVKVAKILHEAFGVRAEPCKLNDRLVASKLYGKKTGQGFYVYDSRGRKQNLNPEIYKTLGIKPSAPSKARKADWIPRMTYLMINEAALCLAEEIVMEPLDVDLGMIMGTGFPPFRGGLLRYADTVGLKNIVTKLEEFEKKFGPRFKPTAPLVDRARQGKSFYS